MSTAMPRMFAAAGHYLQGPGALDLVGEKAAALGKRLAVICDRDIIDLLGDRLRRSFERDDIEAEIVPFAGEVTLHAIERLAACARNYGADVVAGVGGGRALDAGKGVARRLRKPFVSVPTVASSDAPASRGIAIYDDEHRPVVVEQLDENPRYVLVDTGVIAKAPARFLRSGIGDAVSKIFEAQGCWAAGGMTKHGTRPLRSAVLIAEGCYRLLRTHGAAAMRAVEAGVVTDDLEAVVEAAVLLSCLAFENGGLWLAHAVALSLGAARGPTHALHGEQVAYGTLVQMSLEGRAETEIADLLAFYREVGLPIELAGLGLAEATVGEIQAIAEAASTAPYIQVQVPPITAQRIASAVRDVEARATRFKRRQQMTIETSPRQPSTSDLFSLSGRVAIVTGGAGGIGLGIAEALARAGASLVIVDRAPSDEAMGLLREIGVEAVAIEADVTREDDWRRVIELTLARFERIDILVNNAGISLTKAPELVTLEEWQNILNVNMTGAFLGSRGVHEHMKRLGGGKILNTGSLCSILGGAFNVPYTASKGGILQLTRGLAVAWGKDNIQVNALLPGFIETALSQRAKAKMPDLEQRVLARTPAGRWGTPGDFAGVAVFLCSEASDFISGVGIPVDGGYSIQL